MTFALQRFDDEALASLILDLNIDGQRLELFFLSKFDFEELSLPIEDFWSYVVPAEIRFNVSGTPATGVTDPFKSIAEVIDNARSWWMVTMAGRRLPGKRGPKHGHRKFYLPDIETRLYQYVQKCDESGEKPNKMVFIHEWLNIAESTFDDYMSKDETSWAELLNLTTNRVLQTKLGSSVPAQN